MTIQGKKTLLCNNHNNIFFTYKNTSIANESSIEGWDFQLFFNVNTSKLNLSIDDSLTKNVFLYVKKKIIMVIVVGAEEDYCWRGGLLLPRELKKIRLKNEDLILRTRLVYCT